MEPIKIYKFYNEISHDEADNIRKIFLKYNFYDMNIENEDRFHYNLMQEIFDQSIRIGYTLAIYSVNILTNEKLLEELFPYFLNMFPIFERNIYHLLQLH